MSVRAPEFPTDLAWFNGGPLRLHDLRGKVVLLEFWTAGCVNCHHNIPQLHAIRRRFGYEVVIVGVHSAKFPAERAARSVRDAVGRFGIRYPVVHDEGLRVWDEYAVRAWPTLVVVDPDGRIAATHVGEWLADDLAPSIEAMCAAWAARGALNYKPVRVAPTVDRAPSRTLHYPSRLTVAPDGTLFVSDTGHHRVLEIRPDLAAGSGEVVRVWGTGEPGFHAGVEDTAAFHHPRGLLLHDDVLYVADTDNHAIRAINLRDGRAWTLAGNGTKAHGPIPNYSDAHEPLRSPWALLRNDYYIRNEDGRIDTASGPSSHTLEIAMAGAHQLWELSSDTLVLSAGTGYESLEDGRLLSAGFSQPSDLARDSTGIYIVDAEASAVRVIRRGRVRTLVGRGLYTFGDQDGVGDDVRLQHPTGIAAHGGRVYIADTLNNKIKRLTPRSRRVVTLAGTGEAGHRDGALKEAMFDAPEGVAVWNGLLFVADTGNHQIRVVDLAAKTVRTLRISAMRRRRTVVVPDIHAVVRGRVSVEINVTLPPGYKHNPELPQMLTVGSRTLSFDATEQPRVVVDVRDRMNLVMNLTLYPCSIDDGICLIHEARLVVPLQSSHEGFAVVSVWYDVPP